MKKYSEEFKLFVVEAYMTGEAGYTTLGQIHFVPRGLVRRWVTFFKLHGIDGLKRKLGRYDAAFKRSVLAHMWENKLSYSEAAAAFNVRAQCAVSSWERAYLAGGMDALDTPTRRRSKTMPIATKPLLPRPDDQAKTREELLAEIEYLRCEVAVLKKLEALDQSKHAAIRKKRK